MRQVLGIASLGCLGVCLVVPFLYFHGGLAESAYKNTLTIASLGWFVFATMFAVRRGRS